MKNHASIEQEVEEKILAKNRRKTNKMKVSGKGVINLKKIIINKSSDRQK